MQPGVRWKLRTVRQVRPSGIDAIAAPQDIGSSLIDDVSQAAD